MFAEVVLLQILCLVSLVMAVMYWFSPSFTKKLIGQNDPFERKIFHNNLPFWQFLILTSFLPAVAALVVILVNVIGGRESINIIRFGDRFVWWGVLVCCGLISYGVGSHGASVSIGHYMKFLKFTRAYQTVEFYHHIIGHFLPILGLIFMFLSIVVYEFNYPLPRLLNVWEVWSLVLMGALVGASFAFLIIEGRGKYYGIPALMISLTVLIFFAFNLDLVWRRFPMLIFISTAYLSSLVTIAFWRVKNGELKEKFGEFFHE